MLAGMRKALIDMTDDELRESIRNATHATSFVNDWLRELDRREARRQAEHQTRTAYIATGAAIVSALAALIALVVSRS
jgi:hypothetical protein